MELLVDVQEICGLRINFCGHILSCSSKPTDASKLKIKSCVNEITAKFLKNVSEN